MIILLLNNDATAKEFKLNSLRFFFFKLLEKVSYVIGLRVHTYILI